jgi:hypothetical protein
MESGLAMLAFVRTVQCNGFTRAARDLGVTPSAVSKLVTRLERGWAYGCCSDPPAGSRLPPTARSTSSACSGSSPNRGRRIGRHALLAGAARAGADRHG